MTAGSYSFFVFGMEDKESQSLEAEAYDLYESIRPTVEEFCNEWFIVGIRPGCGSRILVGSRHDGWNKLQPAYDAVKKWKEENPLGDS